MDSEEPKKFFKRFWWIIAIVVFLVLLFLVLGSKGTFGGKQGLSNNSGRNNGNCASNPNPVFTAEFTDFDNLAQTAPIGAINAGSPGRAYVRVKGEEGNRPRTPLYAPADSTLISLVYAKRDQNNPNAPGEYRLEFRMSCEVTFNFDHMDDVVDKIKAFAPPTPSDKSNDMKYISIPVKAGELVGYSDGTDLAGSFDLFLLNSAKTVSHINPSRWKWDQVVTADCPYDYYTPELKTKYYSIMRSHDGKTLEKLSCGSPSHDIAGTASGGWFYGKEATDESGKWLEIGNQNGKTELMLRDSEGKIGGNTQVFSIRDYQNKTLPDTLKVGDSTCYSSENKWAYVKLVSDEKLSVATGEGTCPSNFPSENMEEWER